MKGKELLLLAASVLLSLSAYGQKEIKASWITRINLGDGRFRHFEMDGSAATDPEKGKPLNGLYHIYYPEHSSRYTVANFEDGLYDGDWEYHENSLTSEKGVYVAGRREGEFRTYFDSGAVNVIRSYRDGKLDGTERSFYRDGSIAREVGYRAGIEHGPKRDFRHGESEPYQYENYYDGRKHGEQLRLTSDDYGDYYERSNYEHGALRGAFTHTWVDGGVKQQVFYGDNGREGEWFDNYPDGRRRAERTYVDGVPDGKATTWYADGGVEQVCFYKNGGIEGVLTTYHQSNGKKKSEHNYINGLAEGQYRIWFDDGKLREEGLCTHGKPTLRKEFYRNGQVKNVYEYSDYEGWSISESYDPDGKERYTAGQIEDYGIPF